MQRILFGRLPGQLLQDFTAADRLTAQKFQVLANSWIVLRQLARQLPKDDPAVREDLELLRSQAIRCREILQKLTRQPAEQDPLHSSVKVRQLIDEASAPYLGARVPIITSGKEIGRAHV